MRGNESHLVSIQRNISRKESPVGEGQVLISLSFSLPHYLMVFWFSINTLHWLAAVPSE